MKILSHIFSLKLRSKRGFHLAAVLFFLHFFPATALSEVIDKVVAIVNSDVITMSELEAEAKEQYQTMVKSGNAGMLATMEAAREQTLNSLIDRHLLEQKAKELNISVSDPEVESAFEESIIRSGVSRKEFLDKMKEAGFSQKSYMENLRASILQSKLVGVDVRSKIVVTPQMIEEFYQKNYTSKVDGKLYNLLQMGFIWDKDTAPEKTKSKTQAFELAKKTRAEVGKGKDFGKLAKEHSDLPSASDGGDIGSFTLEEMASEMAAAVQNLTPLQVSEIIETPDGYQFFQLLSIEDNATLAKDDLDNVKEEIHHKIYQEKLREAYQNWIKKLKESAYIRKM